MTLSKQLNLKKKYPYLRVKKDIIVMKHALHEAIDAINTAESQGFIWPNHQMILEAITQETAEIKESIEKKEGNQRLKEEIGDLLLACLSLCTYFSFNPEEILAFASEKFTKRFNLLMSLLAQKHDKDLTLLSIEEKIQLWNQAKKLANNGAAGEN